MYDFRLTSSKTEFTWVSRVNAYAPGMTFREIQHAVAGHVRGDRPMDPTRPDERAGTSAGT